MIQARKLGGIIVPLVTPFDERGDLAAKKARTLIERYLDIGVHGFYVGGTSLVVMAIVAPLEKQHQPAD